MALRDIMVGTSLVVQWLGLGAFTAVGPGLIPGRGTKVPQAAWLSQKKKKGEMLWLTVKYTFQKRRLRI